MIHLSRLFLVLGMATLASSCGGSSSDDATGPAESDGPVASDAADDATTEASPTEEGLSGTDLGIGLTPVTLLAPAPTDAGAAPRFEWAAIDGASSYQLVVLGPDGPIWAWTGAETAVWLGGLDTERPPGMAGPEIVPGTCWSVAALDATGAPIALSPLVAVAPDGSEHSCSPG